MILEDELGICRDLDVLMDNLVDTYEDEWAAVVKSTSFGVHRTAPIDGSNLQTLLSANSSNSSPTRMNESILVNLLKSVVNIVQQIGRKLFLLCLSSLMLLRRLNRNGNGSAWSRKLR